LKTVDSFGPAPFVCRCTHLLGLWPIKNRKGKYKRLRDEVSVGVHICRKIIERSKEFLQV